jgi:hypothetical protein
VASIDSFFLGRRLAVLLPVTLSILNGCGSGGSEQSLNVGFGYQNAVGSVFEKSSIQPTITGLNGREFSCSWDTVGNTNYSSVLTPGVNQPFSSSAVSKTPLGFTIDSKSCVITVDSKQPGVHDLVIRISVPGYAALNTVGGSGFAAAVTVSVTGPSLTAAVGSKVLKWAQPVGDTFVNSIKVDGYAPVPGDQFQFISQSLPEGLGYDPSTGKTNGVLKGSVGGKASFVANVTRNGRQILSTPIEIPYSVEAPLLTMPIQKTVASGLPALPKLTGVQVGDSVAFSMLAYHNRDCTPTQVGTEVFETTPSAFAVDENTGAISSTGKIGKFCIGVQARVVRNGVNGFFTAYDFFDFK